MKLDSSLLTEDTPLHSPDLSLRGLNFPIEKQVMSNWCWAAIAASVCRFYNGPVMAQRQIVAEVTGKAVCAVSPPIPFCNDTADIGHALHAVGHLAQQPFDRALTSQETVSFVAGGPVGCQLFLPSLGGGHAVLIYGCQRDHTGTLFLRVADPADAMLLTMPYDQLLNNYRNARGQWIRSYLTA